MELNPPPLDWQQEVPHSGQFGDSYYCAQDGLAEARHVFLAGNGLPERLQTQSRFTIAETGFGTGLNFLALWQLWQSLPQPRPRLHYITTEALPLRAEDMARAHALWPELSALSHGLLAILPPAIVGAHRRWLEGGQIQIDFLYGDATEQLTHYQPAEGRPQMDAWFLDGFAPAKNPQMWQEGLYRAMAQLSHAGTTLASFTSAGVVRRGLQQAGFTVEKTKGYGHKREMIVGRFGSAVTPSPLEGEGMQTERPTLIIGAGIAGLMAVWRLAQQGQESIILEAGSALASGASGNPASAFTPYYTPQWNTRSRVLASGFATMQHILTLLEQRGHRIAGNRDGLLMLNTEGNTRAARLRQWQESLSLPPEIRRSVTAAQASELAGVTLPQGGWFYPQGGWLRMQDVCTALLADAGAVTALHLNTTVTALRSQAGSWEAITADGRVFVAEKVILANAQAAQALVPEIPLRLHCVHGQNLHFTPPPQWRGLKRVLNAGHTLIPLPDGRLSWGASFRHDHTLPTILPEETERLLGELTEVFPELAEAVSPASLEIWAGIRCTHPSRLPLIGEVSGKPGLHLHLAHAARGTLTACYPFAVDGKSC